MSDQHVGEPVRYLSTLSFDEDWLARLQAAVPEVEVRQIPARSPAEVPSSVWAEVDVLHTSAVFPAPAAAPSLRWIQLDTSGVDHVSAEPIWASDVAVTTIGGVSPVPLAEYVLWAILGTAHRLPQLRQVTTSREWPDPTSRWQRFLPASLPGATLVVVGYGRIGREIGRLADAFGMKVVGVTRSGSAGRAEAPLLADFAPSRHSPDPAQIVGPERLQEVAATADYLVVIVPLTPETRNLVDAEVIAGLKPGAAVINVARGGIVDEQALAAALRSGAISGAVLDVFEVEPLPPTATWWDEPNCFVTPHVAGLAPLYSDQVLDLVSSNLRRFVNGEPLLNLVDRERGY